MRRLAFSSNAFKQTSLEDAVRSIAKLGYGGVELMADLHHAYPLTFSASRRRDLRALLSDLGLVVTNINAFTHFVDGDTYRPTWIESDPALRRKRIEHTRRSIELASEMGCASVSIQPGGPLIGRGLSEAAALELFAEGISQCVSAARGAGVTIGIEPEPGLLIESSSEYVRFKRGFFAEEASVRMNCDVGHLFCVGEDPAQVIRALGREIAHVHLEDIRANRVHQHLIPGTGVIDFASIEAALEEVGFSGDVTVELYPYENNAEGVARRAIDYLRKNRVFTVP